MHMHELILCVINQAIRIIRIALTSEEIKSYGKFYFFMIKTMITLRKKTNNHLVEFYGRLKTQPQRKSHKVAIIACMNKILKLVFHLIQHNVPYDYNTDSTCA